MAFFIETVIFVSLTATCLTISIQSTPRCSYEFDETRCVFDVYCVNQYDIPFYNFHQENERCVSESITVYYDRRNYHPVYLTLSNIETSDVSLRETHGSHIITSLDLSNNECNFYPDLPSMENLARINMSRNALTEAKLSSEFEMVSLTEIDYSHNIINNIEEINDGYPFKKLIKLNLAFNYLNNIPDAVFNSFSEMETLDLSHNFIKELDVLTFEGLKNLVHLYLSHNNIKEIGSSLMRFNKLEVLDLSYNKISIIKLNDFQKLISIKRLDLNCNNIVTIEENVFSNMVLLQFLDLSNNVINSIGNGNFVNATRLQSINLFKNNIKTLPKDLFKGNTISTFSIKENNMEGSITRGTFEGLALINELDLSNQQICVVEDLTFFGLESLRILLLNNNTINSLCKNSFKTLRSLNVLDLSRNYITAIDFNKEDLNNLQYLLLSNNNIFQVKPQYFQALIGLQFLDLSYNNITDLTANSFKSLKDLLNFQISHNPISGMLEESTFEGLLLLPSLDISGTFLTTVNNHSFKGMTQLKDLNISHSKIAELQFNAFSNTGAMENLDLSFNRLRNFEVNTTELDNLISLTLSNNFITDIITSFNGLKRLVKINLSYNRIQTIHNEAFTEQKDLRHLDVSFNPSLKFDISLDKCQQLSSLFLSAIPNNTIFTNIGNVPLTELVMSYSRISNVTSLRLSYLTNLYTLTLSNNDIVRVETGAFCNITRLTTLDLSYNRITYIQSGVFKDNENLHLLNISHNSLTSMSYGIFRGLIHLNTIDVSFNSIEDLESERFYELRSLSVLIADYNKIGSLNISEFASTDLSKLSIGGNPLPCNVLVNIKKINLPLTITAIKIDENNDENVQGITCNVDNINKTKITPNTIYNINDDVLSNIRDILRNMSTGKLIPINNDTQYFANISSKIDNIGKFAVDFRSIIAEGNTKTNSLLEKILKVLSTNSTDTRSVYTIDNFTPNFNKLKQDLEGTIAVEKQKILTEIENKLPSPTSRHERPFVGNAPNHDALQSVENTDTKSFIFIEVCVGLILIVLVCFILLRLYNSGIFVPSARSNSTRHLPEAMENSAL